MASNYQILKTFQEWKGLHKGFSNITRPVGYSDDADNCDIDYNLDLIKRAGHQFVSPQSSTVQGDWRGILNYVYFDKNSQSRKEELLAVTDTGIVLRLTEQTFTLDRTAPGTNVLFSFAPNSSGIWQVDLTENGTPVAGYPKTYGTGLGNWTAVGTQELRDLVADLDALANYTCTASLTLDGLGVQLHASVLPLTINADISDGVAKTITYPLWTVVSAGGSGIDGATDNIMHSSVSLLPEFVNVASANLNNILYIAATDNYLYKYDGQRYYRAGNPRAVGVGETVLSAGALTGAYKYHFTFIKKDNRGNIFEGAPSDDFDAGTLAAQRTSLAICAPHTAGLVGYTLTTGPSAFLRVSKIASAGRSTFSTKLEPGSKEAPFEEEKKVVSSTDPIPVQVRGKGTFNDAFGLVAGSVLVVNNTTGTGTATEVTVSSIDETPADYVQINLSSGNITVGANMPIWWKEIPSALSGGVVPAPSRLFCVDGATVNAIASSTTITVVTGHGIIVGDVVYLQDATTLEYLERTVTAITATSITVSGAAISHSSGDGLNRISQNLKVAIWRTKASGTEKYLVAEVPVAKNQTSGIASSTTVFIDNIADDKLVVKYTFPSRSPDPPPKCKYVVVHQGLLILAGNPEAPNTVYFSEPNNAEAFPNSTNNFIVPFSSEGGITGLGIDNGILVIFKDDARAYVQGNIASNTFVIEIQADGIGCPGHHSIALTPAGLIWLSNTGFQKSFNGQLDSEFSSRLALDFANNFYLQREGFEIEPENLTKFYIKRATAIHDHVDNKYICTIPKEAGIVGVDGGNDLHPTSGTVVVVYDYGADHLSFAPSAKWELALRAGDPSSTNYQSILNGYGGYAIYKGDLYFGHSGGWQTGSNTPIAVERYGHIVKRHRRNDRFGLNDQGLSIPFVAATNWETGGEPSVFKKFLRQKTHLSDPSLLEGTSNLTVKAFKDFNDTTAFSQFTQTFTTTTIEKESKIVGQKCKAMKLEYSNNVLNEPVRITGYEYEVAADYGEKIKE